MKLGINKRLDVKSISSNERGYLFSRSFIVSDSTSAAVVDPSELSKVIRKDV